MVAEWAAAGSHKSNNNNELPRVSSSISYKYTSYLFFLSRFVSFYGCVLLFALFLFPGVSFTIPTSFTSSLVMAGNLTLLWNFY